MGHAYKAIQWNHHKRVYDAVIASSVVVFVGGFVGVGKLVWTGERAISDPVLLLRGLAVCAFVMLHVILCIGPAARLSTWWAPLLYNRRHLGVTMFLVALAHAALATLYYGGFGGRNPLGAVLESGTFRSISGFAFEWLGLLAIIILFLMAATSHDFWLNNLGAKVWKRLHMSVYVAYAAVVLHVALGVMQSETSPVAAWLTLSGVVLVATLHTVAGVREFRRDALAARARDDEWIDAAGIDEIPPSRAKVVRVLGCNPIAVFRHEGGFSAVSNVCAHQGGPLGEGRIVGGCITCPWHGFQYLPHNGQSPPPFTEKISTYEVRVRGSRVEVRAKALPPGTPVEPARVLPVESVLGDEEQRQGEAR
jgi:nitrite reductase/ring-hydroxylating ferredoxin subunit/DMSO/TMAO reductase YedYZ heme-binding membrane subunit